MKSIVAAAFLLVSVRAFAQNIQPVLSDIDLIRPQTMQMAQMNVSGVETRSDSTAADQSAGSMLSSSSAEISAALTQPITTAKPPSPKFKTFATSPLNRTLVATEFWSRGLDAFSTHQHLNNPCGCYQEGSHFLGMNMTPMFKTAAGAYSYSLGIAATYSFVSLKLWNASQNHPRHARLLRTLSRALLVGDSSMETTIDVHNFTITDPGSAN